MHSGRSALFLFVLFLAMPGLVAAKDMQADQQCPAGGQVGQKCTDTTNGYMTQGTCTHINVCKATSWNASPPKGCGSSGNIYAPAADCPKGPQISGGMPRPVSTGTPPITIDGASSINSDIFDKAFSDISPEMGTQDKSVSTTSVDGVEYVIFGGETLKAGAPLTEEVQRPAESPEIILPQQRTTLALGSVYGLVPTNAQGVNSPGTNFDQGYSPSIGTFAAYGSKQYSPPVDFVGQTVQLSGAIIGAFAQSVGHLFEGLGVIPRSDQAFTASTPPLSLYDQLHYRQTTFPAARDMPASPGFFDHLWSGLGYITFFISQHVFPSFPR